VHHSTYVDNTKAIIPIIAKTYQISLGLIVFFFFPASAPSVASVAGLKKGGIVGKQITVVFTHSFVSGPDKHFQLFNHGGIYSGGTEENGS
jgi:hypothetical protein